MFIREYIIRSASEERWRLPNPRFSVVIYYHELTVHCYVYDDRTGEAKERFSISKVKSPKNWQYLANEFGELAIKKYPREIRSHAGQVREDAFNRMRRR